MTGKILRALILMLLPFGLAAQEQPTGPYIEGRVVLPDGRPAAGARVFSSAVDCTSRSRVDGASSGRFLGETIANANGGFRFHIQREMKVGGRTFLLPSYKGCDTLLVWASLEEDLWLPTWRESFYREGEYRGRFEKLELVDGLPRHNYPLTVTLSTRGAGLSIEVWDSATERNVEALISLSRHDCSPDPCGLIQFSVRADGKPYTHLVPEGHYRVELRRFLCGDREIFIAEDSIFLKVYLSAGERRSVRLEFDSSAVDALESYSNPDGLPCDLGSGTANIPAEH
jgi:hypothetical protein